MSQRNIFPRICIALGLADPMQLLEQGTSEAQAGESLLEFRLDYLDSPDRGPDIIRAFLQNHPECMVLATCRRHQNHGKFNGAIREQIRILEAAIQSGAQAVDIEIETAEAAPELLENLRGRARLVVSYHNFETTPVLEPVLKRMLRVPADVYKIVTTARKPSDNARVLGVAKANPRTPVVVLAMGQIGFPTRILSTTFGSLYTYAAPRAVAGTASGQVCAKQLRQLYRVEKLSRSAKVYGVIADPVGHSISPAVLNRAFQAHRIDAVYVPFLVPAPHLKDFVTMADKLGVSGFSVTIPHKQKIIRYLDHVEPAARRIGAVNTVWKKAGKWRGANTDIAGVTGPLSRKLQTPKSSILVVGNGGAARSAACALIESGAKVFLTGRDLDRVRTLARACGAEALPREQATAGHFDALVHATPLGMTPHVNACFFEGRIPADVVFDMVYNPLETALIRRAREQGKTVIPGIHMFIEQAVRQFEIWTGEAAPRAAMEKAALEALGQR